VLREYSQHQFTTVDEAELHERKAAAGAKGGRAKAAAVADAKQQPRQDLAGSGIEIGTDKKTDHTHDSDVRHEIPARADLSDSEMFLVEQAGNLGIKRLNRVLSAIGSVVGEMPSARETAIAIDVASAVLELSTERVKYPEAYIERACRESPGVIRDEWARACAAAPKAVA
jgi:hypothetical protein